MFLRFTSKQTYRVFLLMYIFVCHTPQFKLLVFAFRSESWIVQNFNFTVFEDFCLSLSWKYRFLQNVNHAKVQSKSNKYCKFHVDLTRRRLSKSRFKKLGMVPKTLYRNTLSCGYKSDFLLAMVMRFFENCCVASAWRKSHV